MKVKSQPQCIYSEKLPFRADLWPLLAATYFLFTRHSCGSCLSKVSQTGIKITCLTLQFVNYHNNTPCTRAQSTYPRASCMLLLHPTSTCTDWCWRSVSLTFNVTCMSFIPSTSAIILLVPVHVVATLCTLHLWSFPSSTSTYIARTYCNLYRGWWWRHWVATGNNRKKHQHVVPFSRCASPSRWTIQNTLIMWLPRSSEWWIVRLVIIFP